MNRTAHCFGRTHQRANDVLFALVLAVAAVSTGIVTWTVASEGVEALTAVAEPAPLVLELPRVEIVGQRAAEPKTRS